MKTARFHFLWVSLILAALAMLCPQTVSAAGATSTEINNAIVQEGSIPLTWTNDATYPWTISDGKLQNGNVGFANSSSKVSFKYNSAYPTTLTFKFDVTGGSSNHFQVYVDGNRRIDEEGYYQIGRDVTYRLLKGEHTIEFIDTVYNSPSYYYGRLYDVKVAEFSGATGEDYNKIVSRSDVPLTWTNDENFPWGFENERFQNSNAQYSNTQSSVKTTFTIDKPTKIGFKHRVGYNSGSADHILRFFVDGEEYLSNSQNTSFSTYYTVLTPGTYTLEWRYDNKTAGNNYYAEIKDLEISQDWITVDITPGMLGVETLYKVNVLQDVKMIKINGQLNSSDWNVLKQMTSMYAVDLSEATIENIPNEFFKNQTRIKYVKLPEGLEIINASSFYGTGLNEIAIPSTVTSIGNDAFRNATLHKITFANNSQLKTIGESAFRECSLLKEFSMPNSVTSIGAYVFYRCSNLQKMTFSDELTSLPEYTCCNNNSLAEIHFPTNLVSIGNSFMYGANSLKELNLPITMRSIGSGAFAGLHTLKHLIIPEKLNSLGQLAFCNSAGLEIVELPSGVSTYDRTFQGCGSIKKIICRAATPPAVSRDAFSSVTKANATLEVPSFAVATYKLDPYWYQFGNIIEGEPTDYWKIIGDLKLLNNRRMEGKPDIDLYYNGKLTVGGDAAMPIGKFDIYTSDGNASSLVTDCPNITADEINTIYHVDANKWYFITPMVDVDLRQVNVTGTPNYVFRYYDGATRADIGAGTSWKNVSDMTLKSGVGYIFQCNAASDVIFPVPVNMHSRVLTTEAVTLPLVAHPSDNAANKGWNYVGNPFPSYYDIYYMDFTAPITVWTGSTYRAYSITDDNFVLRPMQGFFVQKPDAIDVITLQPAGRQIQSSVNRYQKSPTSRANLKSEDARAIFNIEIGIDTLSDVTRIVLNNNASARYEIERDASKFMSMDETVPQIYSIDSDNNHLAINERPEFNGEIPLGIFIPNQNETYSIRCTRQDGEAYLYDAELNVTHNLANGEYYFSAPNGTVENRFSIRLKSGAITGIDDIPGEYANKFIQSMPDGIEVSNLANSNITVYGLDGKVLHVRTSLNGTSFIPLAKGLYVVNVDGSSYKVLVK